MNRFMACSTALFIVYIQEIFCVTLKQTPVNESAPALFYDCLSQKKKKLNFFILFLLTVHAVFKTQGQNRQSPPQGDMGHPENRHQPGGFITPLTSLFFLHLSLPSLFCKSFLFHFVLSPCLLPTLIRTQWIAISRLWIWTQLSVCSLEAYSTFDTEWSLDEALIAFPPPHTAVLNPKRMTAVEL